MNSARLARIGVLDLQGDVREHLSALARAGAEAVPVKRAGQLEELDGLVIPGGESTTIGRLMHEYGFFEAVLRRVGEGLAVFGTCAGLILIAQEIEGSAQERLGLFPMTVRRNAYGRQRESFEVDLDVPALGAEPLRAVFIRAPQIASLGEGAEALAEFGGFPVLARFGRHLACTFHPELTDDDRVHRLFIRQALGR